MAKQQFKLFVTDIDNTLFDWVRYYVNSYAALLHAVEKIIGVPYDQLAAESREVFTRHGSIEYPFVIQELPSVAAHYGADIDKMLSECVRPGRDAFLAATTSALAPYAGVVETMKAYHKRCKGIPIVALTDAPRYVAMWKLNKLGLLHYFDAVYGLADPRLPTSREHGRVKVDPEILLKHLQQSNFDFKGKIRILPDEYEKPGTRGLKTVLMDNELDENPISRQSVLWVGDNQRKDIGLGKRLGVRTGWAQYGLPAGELIQRLAAFSPLDSIHKNAALPTNEPPPSPDYTLKAFAEVLDILS